MRCSSIALAIQLMVVVKPTPVTRHKVLGRTVFLKRDDLHSSGLVNGNKARKFLSILKRTQECDDVIIASYGGHQSNAMVALSKVAGKSFIYFTKKVGETVKSSSNQGNFAQAIASGMQVVEISKEEYEELASREKVSSAVPVPLLSKYMPHLKQSCIEKCHWVPQGGAYPEAEIGIAQLADEIADFITTSPIVSEDERGKSWKVVIASGTGTMALYMARCLFQIRQQRSELEKINVEVVAIPCVSSSEDLIDEMRRLAAAGSSETSPNASSSSPCSVFPTVLCDAAEKQILGTTFGGHQRARAGSGPAENGKRAKLKRFAEPCKVHLAIWRHLRESTDVEFDLVYAPRAFEIMSQYDSAMCLEVGRMHSTVELTLQSTIPSTYDSSSSDNFSTMWSEETTNILYYVCGGAEGNPTQIQRYKHLGML